MVGRGGNSRNWLSPLFMLIHYSMAKYDNIPGCPGYYISKRGQIYSRVIPNGDDAGKLGKVWRERKVKKYLSCLIIIVMVLVLWN